MKYILALLILMLGPAAYADDAAPHPLGAATLRVLVEDPEYHKLETLLVKSDPASSRHRRLAVLLMRLQGEALSATTIDPDGGGKLNVNYTRYDGHVARLSSLVPQQVNEDRASREDAAGIVVRFIIEDAEKLGWLPFELSPETQMKVDAARKESDEAVKRRDYLAAVSALEKARALAPHEAEIFKNLGEVESKMPGREFRAMAWFGAYLAADPRSPDAPQILAEMRQLDKDSQERFIQLLEKVSAATPDHGVKDYYLLDIADFWARSGGYERALKVTDGIGHQGIRAGGLAKIAAAKAQNGEFDAAYETAEGISSDDEKSAALSSVAEAQIASGNIAAAIKTAGEIPDLFYKCITLRRIADAQSQSGDKDSAAKTLATALKTAAGIKSAKLQNVIMASLAISQAQAGDAAAALRMASGIHDPFNVSDAKQKIAEAQAFFGDWDGASKTLAEALDAGNKVPEDSRDIVLRGYAQEKERLESKTKGDLYEAQAVTPRAVATVAAWEDMNDTELNTPFFLDQRTYLKELPKDDPSKIWESLSSEAGQMAEAHEKIRRMLKELARQEAAL